MPNTKRVTLCECLKLLSVAQILIGHSFTTLGSVLNVGVALFKKIPKLKISKAYILEGEMTINKMFII